MMNSKGDHSSSRVDDPLCHYSLLRSIISPSNAVESQKNTIGKRGGGKREDVRRERMNMKESSKLESKGEEGEGEEEKEEKEEEEEVGKRTF
jgi:hypothetical protein